VLQKSVRMTRTHLLSVCNGSKVLQKSVRMTRTHLLSVCNGSKVLQKPVRMTRTHLLSVCNGSKVLQKSVRMTRTHLLSVCNGSKVSLKDTFTVDKFFTMKNFRKRNVYNTHAEQSKLQRTICYESISITAGRETLTL